MTNPVRSTFHALSKVPFPTTVLATTTDPTRDAAVEMLRCAFDQNAALSDNVSSSSDWDAFDLAWKALDHCQGIVRHDVEDYYADSCLEAAQLLEEGWTP